MGMKNRLDIVLVEKGYFDSREKAKSSIMAGIVFVNNQRIDKPGTKIDVDEEIEVRGKTIPYVGRGGLKLEKAINVFHLDLMDKSAMDIGASTGGFTDCMLQNGAKKVYAIDVGYGQLDWKLRQDPRVISMERTNIRYVEKSQIHDEIDFASIDVSFISLKLVLPVAKELIRKNGEVVCLIKPQFEAGRGQVGRKGVVKDLNVHREVLHDILSFSLNLGFTIKGLSFSPIKGQEGNIEYLVYLINHSPEESMDLEKLIESVGTLSHDILNNHS